MIATAIYAGLLLTAIFLAACSTLEKAEDVSTACMPQLQDLRACVKEQLKKQPAPAVK